MECLTWKNHQSWEKTFYPNSSSIPHKLCRKKHDLLVEFWRSKCPNISATPIGQMGLEMGWFPLGNGVCLIMKKAPSDSPIWQLKKRELLLPLSFLITKPLKLDLSNLHYGPHYKPHYRTQGCVIRENNFTAPLRTYFNPNGSVRWRTSVYLNLFHWLMEKNSGNRTGVCSQVTNTEKNF